MAYVLGSVNEISQIYLANEKRYNYTTPKSFLELISLYSKLLTEKTNDNEQRIRRLENGLVRLAQCAEQVDSLKVCFYMLYVVCAHATFFCIPLFVYRFSLASVCARGAGDDIEGKE